MPEVDCHEAVRAYQTQKDWGNYEQADEILEDMEEPCPDDWSRLMGIRWDKAPFLAPGPAAGTKGASGRTIRLHVPPPSPTAVPPEAGYTIPPDADCVWGRADRNHEGWGYLAIGNSELEGARFRLFAIHPRTVAVKSEFGHWVVAGDRGLRLAPGDPSAVPPEARLRIDPPIRIKDIPAGKVVNTSPAEITLKNPAGLYVGGTSEVWESTGEHVVGLATSAHQLRINWDVDEQASS